MNNLGLYFYLIQQNINTSLSERLSQVTLMSVSTIFIGGLLTSLSPCMLSCLPISVGYINQRKNKFFHSFLFISGTLTSIVLIGLSSLIIKKSYTVIASITNIITPIIILVIGLSLLNIIELQFYPSTELKNRELLVNHSIESYILGLTIGFNISPCTTPILMTIIAWITNTKQILVGLFLLLIYGIGYIIPIILSLISIRSIKKLKWTTFIWTNIIPLSGSMIVATGTFSLCHTIIVNSYVLNYRILL